MNIYEKLQKSRILLQEMNLKKSGKNKFAGFSYYELADFLPSVNKTFEDLKLYSMFSLDSSRAFLTVVNSEKPEEKVVFESPTADIELKGCSAIQSIGATHTYMKRYLYLNALEIVENDMHDAVVGKIQEESINKKNPFDYEGTVECIKDVKQLNKTYKFFVENAKDNLWKNIIKTKADKLQVAYNKNTREFEPLSV